MSIQVATHDGLPRRSRFILAVSIGLGECTLPPYLSKPLCKSLMVHSAEASHPGSGCSLRIERMFELNVSVCLLTLAFLNSSLCYHPAPHLRAQAVLIGCLAWHPKSEEGSTLHTSRFICKQIHKRFIVSHSPGRLAASPAESSVHTYESHCWNLIHDFSCVTCRFGSDSCSRLHRQQFLGLKPPQRGYQQFQVH